ncbi:hypothetical protein Csa_022947, partial [Cucumis sativus]
TELESDLRTDTDENGRESELRVNRTRSELIIERNRSWVRRIWVRPICRRPTRGSLDGDERV